MANILHLPPAGAFDPADITLTDDTSGALLIKEGSNEYMRIDTTNGSELVRISTPGSSGTAGIFFNVPAVGDAFYIQRTGGSPATKIVSNAGTTLFQVDSSQILADLIASNKTFKVDGTPGTTPLIIEGDGETTFTLDASASSVFKVQDNAGTPNDYIKLNTASGSELTNLKAGGTQGIAISGNSRTDLVTGSTTSASDIRIINSGGTQIFQVKGNHDTQFRANNFSIRDAATNTAYLATDTNTNFTYTLNTANNALFKVQDNLASPTQFLTIDSNTASESIKLALTPANADRFFEMTSSKVHARCQNSQINMGINGINFTGYDDFDFGQYGAGKKLRFEDRQTAEERFSVDKESNATFTLDGASAATFKVVDSNATPKTYLSITESTQSYAADPYVHTVKLGDNNGYFNLGSGILRANAISGGATGLYGPASYLFGHTPIGLTTSQTYGDFDPCSTPYTFTMSAAATGNVTIDSGFTVRGDYQTGSNPIQSYPVLWVFQNDNATHNFVLSFDGGSTGLEHTKSGDTDAAALISAAGLTLTPGQRYIVRFQKIVNELLLIESVDKH